VFIPLEVQAAVTRQATLAVKPPETERVSVTVTHHDVGSQLGEYCNNEFYGYDEPIDLTKILKQKR